MIKTIIYVVGKVLWFLFLLVASAFFLGFLTTLFPEDSQEIVGFVFNMVWLVSAFYGSLILFGTVGGKKK